MNIVEKLFALRAVPPFDRLHDAEAALIAEAASTRQFAPGETLCGPHKPLQRLHIVIDGEVVCEKGTGESFSVSAPALIGLRSLLFDSPSSEVIRASTTHNDATASRGTNCLVLTKGNLYTILNECPALAVGLLELCQEEASHLLL